MEQAQGARQILEQKHRRRSNGAKTRNEPEWSGPSKEGLVERSQGTREILE